MVFFPWHYDIINFKHHVLIQLFFLGFFPFCMVSPWPFCVAFRKAAGVLPDAEILLGSDFPEDASEVRRLNFAASV